MKTPIPSIALLALSCLLTAGADLGYIKQDSGGNARIAGRMLSRQVTGILTNLVGTNQAIDVGAVRFATSTITNDTVLTITGLASTNAGGTTIEIYPTGTSTLTLAGANITGLSPATVPAGVQYLRVTGIGATNRVTLDWKQSSTNGFLKQTSLGIDVEATDIVGTINNHEGRLDSLEDSAPDLSEALWQTLAVRKGVPRFYAANGGSAAAIHGDGTLFASISGGATSSSADANQEVSINWESAATTDSLSGVNGAQIYKFSGGIEAAFSVRLMETNAIRHFTGISSIASQLNATASTNPVASFFGVFYDSAVSPNWWFSVKDGTTLNSVNTGVTASTNSVRFGFRYVPSTSCELLVNGSQAGELTSELPSTSAIGRMFTVTRTTEDVAKNLRFSRATIISYP